MRKQQVLLVDRAPEFGEMISAALRGHFIIDRVESVARALAAMRQPIHDGFLVDISGAADDPGMDFLRALRQSADSRPVIALSGNLDRELPARCYEAGAHGFVLKTRTLVRELRGLLPTLLQRAGGVLRTSQRRTDGIELPRLPFKFGGATIDPKQMIARFDGCTVHLNPKEIGILHLFALHKGGLLRRSEILAQVWGPDAVPTSKSLDTYMTRLRQAYCRGGGDLRPFVTAKPKVGWRVKEVAS